MAVRKRARSVIGACGQRACGNVRGGAVAGVACGGVGVGMVEGVEGAAAVDLELEGLVGARVNYRDGDASGGLGPEQGDLDPIADPVSELTALAECCCGHLGTSSALVCSDLNHMCRVPPTGGDVGGASMSRGVRGAPIGWCGCPHHPGQRSQGMLAVSSV